MKRILLTVLIPAFILMACQGPVTPNAAAQALIPVTGVGTLTPRAYLPLMTNRYNPTAASRTVNAYYVDAVNVPGEKMHEMSIVWFGQVTNNENYADVRVGYNNTALFVRVGVIDRWLQFTEQSGQTLEQWDAFTLLLSLDGNTASQPTTRTHRLVVEFSGNNEDPLKKMYTGSGSAWVVNSALAQSVDVSTTYRGEDLVNNIDIRGWSTQYTIPFSALGLSGKPADGTIWGLGMILHDRDSASGPALPVKTWPETSETNIPGTWGRLRFGVPGYAAPVVTNLHTTTIRQGLNGALVPDSDVGGSSACGDEVDWRSDWANWGNYNQGYDEDFNISNEAQMEHWPCYSKYYVTFPLNAIPSGKDIRSATLRLHQFGGADPTQAYDSLIQVLIVSEPWNEATLTWNSAPMAMENVSRAWVQVYDINPPVWPGAARNWDVSRAAALAFDAGQPLRLVLYSAEAPQHTGKYFVSSDVEDWNAVGRPSLIVEWGDP